MSSSRWSLQNKKALITGATKGIGLAIAQEYLQLGAEVFIVARNAEHIEYLLQGWHHAGYKAYGLSADLNYSHEACIKIIEAVTQTWGQLDILVNNAGINIRKPVQDYTLNEYSQIMRTNLDSVFWLCQLAYPLLKQSVQANIINIASISGLIDDASGAPYGMSKAAMIQLTKHLAVEWAKDNIRVNAIAPWYIETALTEETLNDRDKLKEILQRTPLQRVGKPQDISATAAFLAMPTASYITGQCICIDGGFMANGFAKHNIPAEE
jgi:tropinone reductase I